MKQPVVFARRYASLLGDMLMTSNGDALTGLWFLDTSPCTGQEANLPIFEETSRWLDQYFRGERPDFLPKLCFSGTEFQMLVWELLLEIPYGETVSYKEIAERAAKRLKKPRMSAQAVGGAVGKNPISILVPCHRVIGSDRSMTGYAGGIWRKEALLKIEKGL